MIDRRRFTSRLLAAGTGLLGRGGLGAAAGLGALSAGPVAAQSPYPNRTIRVVVPYPAGGIVDIVIRSATDRMSANSPQRLIVDNKPGADGRIGLESVAKAPADGYTLCACTPIVVINEFLQPDPTFRGRDFIGIGGIAAPTSVFVVPEALPVRTLKEFIDYARARPGQLNVPNPGSGSSIHLGQEVFFDSTGIQVQVIGYKGQPPAIPDMIQNQLSFGLISQNLVLPHIKAGRLRALAVNASARSPSLPDVPTIGEAGFPQALVLSWYGLAAPAATPAPIVAWLSAELQKVMAKADTQTTLEGMDAQVMPLDTAAFNALMRDESQRWSKLIRERNIKVS